MKNEKQRVGLRQILDQKDYMLEVDHMYAYFLCLFLG